MAKDLDRALSEIADIQAHLAASTRFRGIAPDGNVLAAALALGVASAQALWPNLLATNPLTYIVVWAGVTVVSTVLVLVETIARTRRLHGPLANAMLLSGVRTVLPFAAAGIVITSAICTFSLQSAWILPGIWQILIALIGFSAAASLPKAIVWVSVWYFLSGAVVLGTGGLSGALSPWMMGIPMTVGQVAVALVFHYETAGPGRRRM